AGELQCETLINENARTGIDQPEFYGRMVQANQRLQSCMVLPIWVVISAVFCGSVLLQTGSSLGWNLWYAYVGLVLVSLAAGRAWTGARQQQLFRAEICPMMAWQIQRYRLEKYSLIGVLQQHSELRQLGQRMTRWID
ncbi:MAG: hypothetical protein ABGZ17_15230, partial [Planctomycetaceae bacterium]